MAANSKNWALIISIFIGILSLAFRIPALNHNQFYGYAANSDAASHIAATVTAMERTPASVHHYLPILTMGAPTDLYVDNLPTAARLDATGHVYYTSWPPGIFTFAWAAKSLSGFAPTPAFFIVLASFLQIITAGLLGAVCYLASRKMADDKNAARIAGLIGFVLYMASFEGVKSHTYSLWAEHLWEPLFLIQIILYQRRRLEFGIPLIGAVAGLIDWTAYIANSGFFLVFCLRWYKERKAADAGLALAMVLANVGGLVAMYAWFASVIPLKELFGAQMHRSSVRAAGNMFLLIPAYVMSVGATILVPFYIYRQRRQMNWQRLDAGLLVLMTVPLIENLVMSQHAISYSYDRLKFVALLAVVITVLIHVFAVSSAKVFYATAATCMLSLIAFLGVSQTMWSPRKEAFQRDAWAYEVIKSGDKDALLFANLLIRGNALAVIGRNVAELDLAKPVWGAEHIALMRKQGTTKALVYIFDKDGRHVTIRHIDLAKPAEVVEARRRPD